MDNEDNDNRKEPRYHLSKHGVMDLWESKTVKHGDIIMGHSISYELPERFVLEVRNIHDMEESDFNEWSLKLG